MKMQGFCAFSGWGDVFPQYQGHLTELSTDTYRKTHQRNRNLPFPTAKEQFCGRQQPVQVFQQLLRGILHWFSKPGKCKLLKQHLHGGECTHACTKIAWQQFGRIPTP